MNSVAIAVGSNISPHENVEKVKDLISTEQQLIAESTFTVTSPVDYADQDDFLNGVLLVSTALDLGAFESWLKEVEDRLGRVRTANKNGPRTIDLDIIVWNGRIIDDDFYTREFVRTAVLELLPELPYKDIKKYRR